MNNVININKSKTPNDLMTFKELEFKHGFKYGYLYKWACIEKQIEAHIRGVLKLSESEVLEFENNKRLKKYGRD